MADSYDSDTTTRGLRVQVRARYHPHQSRPAQGYFFFTYTVRLLNTSDRAMQLVSRYWAITDATGRQEHVSGLGVAVQQPRLAPGQSHEYTSGCSLPTSMGSMEGYFEMVLDDGERFEAAAAAFTLADPLALN